MKLYRIVVGPIQENCYLIKNEETGEGIIIDPGDEALKIMEAVKKAGIKKLRPSLSPTVMVTIFQLWTKSRS